MKKYSVLLLVLGLIMNVLYAQAPTKFQVEILKNHFDKVNLTSAYGSTSQTYASANIVNDKFTMTVNLPNDIYRFDFGGGSSMLVVVTPGETVNMTIDAENLQQIVSVSGSETMQFVKTMTTLAMSRKTSVDSINKKLQEDPDKIYWGDFAQKFNLYRQTNDDVDDYLLLSYDDLDSVYQALKANVSGGKVKGNAALECADVANRMLKKLEINYAPFANYQENVDRYYDFSAKRMPNANDFYQLFDQYQANLKARHDIAKNSIGKIMPVVKQLLAVRDSMAYNNLWEKKGNQTKWINQVAQELYPSMESVVSQKAAYEKLMVNDKQNADKLVSQSQEKVSKVVGKYQQAYNDLDAYITSRMKDEIKTHKQDIGVLMFLDVFPREQNAALHAEVITALHDKYPDHLIVQDRWNYMNSPANRVAIGAIAPDLEFPDPDGKMRKLSDLRGKVVLLDFWASWCGPCRRENPNVTKIYAQYHDKGFEVFSVSLDSDAASWKRAIEADKLVWPNHVSDLKKWQSQAAAIYGVRSIPSTFLLDKEGRIIQRDLRGADLERAVKQLVEQ
ncbi:MAG: TlpA family protein disulfide reductase [Bacteroidales bacterium]|nr:TlpA family protein disulfide reductase [Bacteroidales bacterium]